MLKAEALRAILAERSRQDQLKAEGRFPATCADDIDPFVKLGVLGEEYGEVARALLEPLEADRPDKKYGHVREELIQVAAVALAWLESL